MHRLRSGGGHAEAAHVRLLLDCAQTCATGADFMIRGSDLHALTCGACAEICQRCADECERVAGGDEQTARRAEACRRRAESCRRVALAA